MVEWKHRWSAISLGLILISVFLLNAVLCYWAVAVCMREFEWFPVGMVVVSFLSFVGWVLVEKRLNDSEG